MPARTKVASYPLKPDLFIDVFTMRWNQQSSPNLDVLIRCILPLHSNEIGHEVLFDTVDAGEGEFAEFVSGLSDLDTSKNILYLSVQVTNSARQALRYFSGSQVSTNDRKTMKAGENGFKSAIYGMFIPRGGDIVLQAYLVIDGKLVARSLPKTVVTEGGDQIPEDVQRP